MAQDLVVREFFRQTFQFTDRTTGIDLAYSFILNNVFEVRPTVNAGQHRESISNIRYKLARNIMRLVIRMKRNQPDLALREQARNFQRVDLIEKQHIIQIARGFFRLQLCEFGTAADEQKPEILPVTQALDQLHEYVHALGDAHIADVDEDLAAGQRGIADGDAAADIRRN